MKKAILLEKYMRFEKGYEFDVIYKTTLWAYPVWRVADKEGKIEYIPHQLVEIQEK